MTQNFEIKKYVREIDLNEGKKKYYDILSFAILQDEKALIAEHYAAASNEFRARLPEFRGMNPALLDRLEALQHRLGEAAKQNNASVSRIYEQSKENTQNTLLSAQELGQTKHIRFANDTNTDSKKESEVNHG